MTPTGDTKDTLADMNPEGVDFRVASELFAELREKNDRSMETLRPVRCN